MPLRSIPDQLASQLKKAAEDFLLIQLQGGIDALRRFDGNPYDGQIVRVYGVNADPLGFRDYRWFSNDPAAESLPDVVKVLSQRPGCWKAIRDPQTNTNTADIATNAADIAQNTADIATITGDVATLQGDLAALTAADVAFVAAGGIASTDVQAAIEEVDSEKVAKAGDTMTGDLTLDKTATADNARITIDAQAGNNGIFRFKEGGVTKGQVQRVTGADVRIRNETSGDDLKLLDTSGLYLNANEVWDDGNAQNKIYAGAIYYTYTKDSARQNFTSTTFANITGLVSASLSAGVYLVVASIGLLANVNGTSGGFKLRIKYGSSNNDFMHCESTATKFRTHTICDIVTLASSGTISIQGAIQGGTDDYDVLGDTGGGDGASRMIIVRLA